MSITGYLPTNWFEAYAEVCKAMNIDPDFCLDVLTAMSDEAAELVVRARQIVADAFDRQNAERRSRRLSRKNAVSSIIVRSKIAPRKSNETPDLLWRA